MAPTGPARFVDWVWASGSDAHVANHRDWFTSFTPFESKTANGLSVGGVGTVAIDAAAPEDASGNNSNRIVLHDVLWAPEAICNIIGTPILDNYEIAGQMSSTKLYSSTGEPVGVFDLVVLLRLRLAGQDPKQTSLDKNQAYFINVTWDRAERGRWQALKSAPVHYTRGPSTQLRSKHPYVPSEKRWLKENFGGEFEFLREHDLSIYKEKDREEGRDWARTLMDNDMGYVDDDDYDEEEEEAAQYWDAEDDEEDEEAAEDEDEEDGFLADLERDPTAHAADYVFSKKELDWIEKNYRHSGNFLLSNGLKFYDTKDCEEGKAMVKAMMEDNRSNALS